MGKIRSTWLKNATLWTIHKERWFFDNSLPHVGTFLLLSVSNFQGNFEHSPLQIKLCTNVFYTQHCFIRNKSISNSTHILSNYKKRREEIGVFFWKFNKRLNNAWVSTGKKSHCFLHIKPYWVKSNTNVFFKGQGIRRKAIHVLLLCNQFGIQKKVLYVKW